MCGFAGVVSWDQRFMAAQAVLDGMSDAVAHRGPDASGSYCGSESANPDGPFVGLVHRRLAILDLDPRAKQPLSDNRGRWIVFNGEIYNFRELRREISSLRPSFAWRTQSDTEVLLAAYATWGAECVQHLNGMFAFAIWDELDGVLLLARDRMGQKPLYFATPPGGSGQAIAFASELPALLHVPWVQRELDQDALVEYLRWGYVPHPRTIYRGVRQLSPGEIASVSAAGAQFQVYFDAARPAERDDALSDGQAVARTRELLQRAVTRQLVSDVPIGCLLSGGIDSSIIAACMRSAVPAGQPVHTFSIGFDDPRYDESAHAAEVARALGTEHHCFHVRPDAAGDLPTIAAAFGEPFADSSALPTFYLSREVRRHVTVALSGDGGDELFGGYDRYRAVALASKLPKIPAFWRGASAISASFAASHPKSGLARARRFARSMTFPCDQRYPSYLRIMEDDLIGQLLSQQGQLPDPGGPGASYGALLRQFADQPVRAAAACDRAGYLPDDLLTKVDRCSMRFALEVRSPMMDHELVSHAAALSASQLLRGGAKRMLRQAFAADLPPSVFARRKMGFAVPIGDWFRAQLRPLLWDTLLASDAFAGCNLAGDVVRRLVEEHDCGRADHTHALYALLMLQLWTDPTKKMKAPG